MINFWPSHFLSKGIWNKKWMTKINKLSSVRSFFNAAGSNEYKRAASPYGPSIKYVRKFFRKTNISNPLIRTRTCAYQGVRNVSFSENFAYVLNGWLHPSKEQSSHRSFSVKNGVLKICANFTKNTFGMGVHFYGGLFLRQFPLMIIGLVARQSRAPCIKRVPGTSGELVVFAFPILKILKLFTCKICEMFVCKHTETIEYVKN